MEVDGESKSSTEKKIVETEPFGFDLETYSSRYEGLIKIRRLLFIAAHCPVLEKRAVDMALVLIKQGFDTQLYRKVIREESEKFPEYVLDQEWIEKVERLSNQMQEKKQAELSHSKSQIALDSTILDLNELGDLHFKRGDFSSALKSYVRTKDHCKTPTHNAEMCLNLLRVLLFMETYRDAARYVEKGESIRSIEQPYKMKFTVLGGLAALKLGNYEDAANRFVQTNITVESTFLHILTCEDIAFYGGLCSLATFSRKRLKVDVLENHEFKKILDFSPQIRELIKNFYQGKYRAFFGLLNQLYDWMILDLYLQSEADKLIGMISDKCYEQYLSTFFTVDLNQMSTVFGKPLEEVETNCLRLIGRQVLNARIDSQRKILHIREKNARAQSYQKAIEVGDKFTKEMRLLLLRMSCLEHKLVVEGKVSVIRGEGSDKEVGEEKETIDVNDL